MSDQLPPGPGVPPGYPTQPQNPKAAARAAKAYAKATRPWYKKKRVVLPAGFVLLIVIIAAASSGGGTDDGGPTIVSDESKATGNSAGNSTESAQESETAGSDDAEVGSKENPVKIGQTVALEGTEYTVTAARATEKVGQNQFLAEKANGVFVVVELTIENKKDETKTFLEDATTLIAGNGKSYSTDDDGTFAAMGDNQQPLIYEDMQPDVPTSGLLVFDIPADQTAGSLLEVSDLFGGGEAYIDLGLK